MAFAQTDNLLSPYRKFLVELSSYISGNDLETLKFAVVDLIPRRKTEDASSGLKLFDILEQDLRISPGNLSLLEDLFKTIGRMDLALKVQYFSKSTLADNSRNNINGTEFENLVTDGGGDEAPKCQTAKCVAKSVDFEDVVTDGVGDESESDPKDRMADCVDRNNAVASTAVSVAIQGMLFTAPPAQTFRGIEGVQVTPAIPVTQKSSTEKSEGSSFAASTSKSSAPAPALTPASAPAGPGPAPVPVPAPSVTSDASAQAGQGRLQHDSIVGPPPRRYVNYLAYQLVGYQIHVKKMPLVESKAGRYTSSILGPRDKDHIYGYFFYGCNLDVSIDGYDVGGWVVYGGQELTIERPAYEAKKFTFYRVKTAPKKLVLNLAGMKMVL
ncbi:unnamed protein product [Porites lobata]|uniref:DED domain-containing protein n=1 Tax=Porites lobata TaxID=104759 RepID=A0ABN8SBK0_9CNID|nr:unnamed protein product [Porites lobata]